MPFKDTKGSRIPGFKGSSVFLPNHKLLTLLILMILPTLLEMVYILRPLQNGDLCLSLLTNPAHRGRRHFSEALALIGHKVPFSKSLTFIIEEYSLGQ